MSRAEAKKSVFDTQLRRVDAGRLLAKSACATVRNKRRDCEPCAKNFVSDRSGGQALCLKVANHFVLNRRKSFRVGAVVAKNYVRLQVFGVGHTSWPLRQSAWPPETKFLATDYVGVFRRRCFEPFRCELVHG